MSSIGEQIIDAIIAGKLVRAECPDSPGSSCVLVWSANVYEQIDQIVWNYDPAVENGQSPIVHFARKARPFDQVHDIVAGYGRVLFPWRGGRWLMLTDKWRLRWTRGFHNCTATGVR
jgi:hypothetical protein